MAYDDEPVRLTGGGLRRALIAAVAGVVVLGLLALLTWRVVAADARGDVQVGWAGPVRCSGTTVGEERVDGRLTPVVRLRRGMRCELPVRIVNGGRMSVEVTRIRVPALGPEGGAPVHVPRLVGAEPLRPQANDAVFRTAVPLAPAESHEVTIPIELRGVGCMGPGLFRVEEIPQVRVRALGRPGLVAAEQTLGFRGAPDGAPAGDCADERSGGRP
jgi:hypothetical protein